MRKFINESDLKILNEGEISKKEFVKYLNKKAKRYAKRILENFKEEQAKFLLKLHDEK